MGYEDARSALIELIELVERGAAPSDWVRLPVLFAELVHALLTEPLLFASREADLVCLKERVDRASAILRQRTEFYQALIDARRAQRASE